MLHTVTRPYATTHNPELFGRLINVVVLLLAFLFKLQHQRSGQFNGNGESMQFLGTMYLYHITTHNDAVSALQVNGQNLC